MEWFAEYLTLFGDRHSERRTLLDSLQPSRREPLAALFGFMPGRGLLFPKTLMTSPWSDRCHSLPTSLPLNPASLPLFRASLPFLPASLPFSSGIDAIFCRHRCRFSRHRCHFLPAPLPTFSAPLPTFPAPLPVFPASFPSFQATRFFPATPESRLESSSRRC